jgi:DNA-binding NarL/FixJ family response regulator
MKVLLVDDHPVFRSGLARLIETVFPRPLLLQAGDGVEGLAMIRGHGDIALALVDLGLPGDPDGLGLVREVRRLRPKLPVVVISGSEGDDIVRSVKVAGASAFLPKSASAALMIDTLKRHMPAEALHPDALSERAAGQVETDGLTTRQIEVLALVCEGRSNKEICAMLGLAEQTVKAHVSAIFRALRVTSRTQAVLAATKLGLLPPP